MKNRNYHPYYWNCQYICKKENMKKGINNEIKETLFVLNHPQLKDAIDKSKKELETGCFLAQQNEESIPQFLDRISRVS